LKELKSVSSSIYCIYIRLFIFSLPYKMVVQSKD